jgi:molybdopterin/thiamine biosynthesis adenylyltransferase
MNTILIEHTDKENLFNHLLQNPNQENMAAAFCGICKSKKNTTIIVKEIITLQSDDLVVHTRHGLEIKEKVYREILLKAKILELSIIVFHSHPFAQKAWFSSIDDSNDLLHGKFIKKHIPFIFYANVIVSQNEFKARLFDKRRETFIDIDKIKAFGKFSGSKDNSNLTEYDRNYRAFTKPGQKIISSQKVAIVGCGGLGWQIALQLTSLGVGKLLLIDPDKIEKTNLNRLPALPHSKAGKSKARILASILKIMSPRVQVNYRSKSVLDRKVENELKDYDIIVGAIDSENIRLFLNNFSVKYLKYYLDAGSEIILENGIIKHAGGQVTTVIPGTTPCLCCNHLLDYKMISYENLDTREKQAEVEGGYIRGVNEPSASIVSINGVVASSLVNEFIALTTKFTTPNSYLFFDFLNKEKLMFPVQLKKNENCLVCSREGIFGYGDVEKQKEIELLPSFLKMEE